MIGKTISHYEIIEQLGVGGMGVVYKANDTRLKRQVALKFLSSELSHNEDAKNRFIREAQAASALDHPNICNVHEIDQTEDGQLFICMTFYEGDTLKKKIDHGPLPLQDVVTLSLQIAQGLARAHKAGIFHRDLKPANIMLTRQGELKIVDFGLAKLSGQQELTKEGSTIGTVAYMSPEQAKGHTVDHRTDLWSFGVILYELLTGELPFPGDYDQAVIYSVLNEEPEAIQNFRKDVPLELVNIVKRSLMKDPKDRYSSMDDIVLVLEQYQQGITPGNQIFHLEKKGLIKERLKKYQLLIFVFVILFVIFGLWEIFFSQKPAQYLAVLPFQIIGQESIDESYRDGFLEIINSKLTQIEQFEEKLWIISGAEVRDNNIVSVAEAHDIVGADLVITGSVSRLEGALRFTINLVEAESFVQLESRDPIVDRDQASVIESKIIDNIIDMLNIELGQEGRSILYAGGTRSPDAHDYYVRGRGYLIHPEDSQNIDTAISLFKKALSVDSTYLLIYTGLGEAYWKKYDKTKDSQFVELSKKSCQKAMELKDKYAEVNITCGIIFRGIGEYEKAIETLTTALSIDPNNATASLELGLAYLLKGNLLKAEETFQRTVTHRPGYWQGHSYLGFFYYSTGEYEKAVEHYQKIVELIPHSDVGYRKLAAVSFQMEKTEDFISYSESAMKIKPTYSLVNNLAVSYFYSGDYEKATSAFKQALNYNIHDYLIYGNIATASYFSGQKDSAMVYYNKALELGEIVRKINPRDDVLLSNLAGYYVKLDSTQKAYQLLDKVISMKPNNVIVIFNIGDIYEQLGNREAALSWMNKAIENGITLAKFKSNPGLKDLIADDRFKKIIKDLDSSH